jgi:hypothetical protein
MDLEYESVSPNTYITGTSGKRHREGDDSNRDDGNGKRHHEYADDNKSDGGKRHHEYADDNKSDGGNGKRHHEYADDNMSAKKMKQSHFDAIFRKFPILGPYLQDRFHNNSVLLVCDISDRLLRLSSNGDKSTQQNSQHNLGTCTRIILSATAAEMNWILTQLPPLYQQA